MEKENQAKKQKFSAFNAVVYVFLLLHAVMLIAMLAWAISVSLTSNEVAKKGFFIFPDFAFGNYSHVVKNFKFMVTRGDFPIEVRLFPDIIIYTILYTVGGAFVSALVPCFVAYVVAKFKNFVSKILYTIVIVTMIVPIIGNQPAMIKVMMTLNIYDTIFGAWILRANFLGMYFLIFVSAFKALSDNYMEAAYIDGASEWRVLLTIMFPLVKTIFFTVMLIQFVDCWNDYGIPLLYIPSHPTIAYGVYRMSNTVVTGLSSPPMKMAACAIMVIPTVTLFIIFKDKLMGNLSMGGIKG